ncbi:ATP synthase subunit b [bacterium BMS3Abin03]|nr:ATP synthase subunit b [bacterium BMS3Abin03]HDZ58958.1 ATP synthase F0 subunit B [Ignavibacteriales bacterium]
MLAEILIGVLASEGGGGALMSVNPGLIIWTFVTFAALLIILKKVAWKPILMALDNREREIAESLSKAEQAKLDAQKILEENQASLAKAEDESKKIIEQSRIYAEKLKEQMMKESKEQAQRLIEDASAEIERRKDAAFDDLKNQIADISVRAAEKIMKESLDKEKNKRIVEKYLSEISKN